MYRKFASFYDDLMSDYDYDAWSDRIVAAIRELLPTAERGLDLACGSGNFTVRFARAGFRMTGSDASADMLAAATEKSAGLGIRYFEQRIEETVLPAPVDFMTIMCDGVNYCTDGVDFGRLADGLIAGGVLIFDISSPYRLTQTLGDRFYYEDRDEITYFWQNSYDPQAKTVTMELTFFAPVGALYERFDEEHVMRVYEIDELRAALEPYFETKVYGDAVGQPVADDSLRIHFVCRKK